MDGRGKKLPLVLVKEYRIFLAFDYSRIHHNLHLSQGHGVPYFPTTWVIFLAISNAFPVAQSGALRTLELG